MNRLSDIISNAIDLAGGTQLDLKLNSATLLAMNVVADMTLELSHSSRGRQAVVTVRNFHLTGRSGTLAAVPSTGTIPAVPSYIRYRDGARAAWQIIDIVSDIEDLTRAENENRLAIMFFGAAPHNYRLSFEPSADLNQVELWGAAGADEPDDLNEGIGIPDAYAHLAANRTALLLLNDLLLNPNSAALMPFVQSRTAALMLRLRDLEHRWTVYRSNADNSQSAAVTRPYNPLAAEEYDVVFENFN